MASWSSVNAFFEWMTTTPNNNEACVLHAPCESHFAKHGHCSGRLPHGQRLGRILDGLAAQERALAACYFVALAVCERRTRTRRHCSSARGRFLAAANQGMAWHACGASRTVNNFLLHLECAASLTQPSVRRHFPQGAGACELAKSGSGHAQTHQTVASGPLRVRTSAE